MMTTTSFFEQLETFLAQIFDVAGTEDLLRKSKTR